MPLFENFQWELLLDDTAQIFGQPSPAEVVWLEKAFLFPPESYFIAEGVGGIIFGGAATHEFCPVDVGFLPVGGIRINGLQLSTDPNPYEPLNWEKRYSTHMTIGGGYVIQDFGTFMKDNTLKLASGGEPRFLTELAVVSLHTFFRDRGKVYPFIDWLGNEFNVFIKSFVVVPFRKGGVADHPSCEESIWTYEMTLQVTSIIKLFGVPYTGT